MIYVNTNLNAPETAMDWDGILSAAAADYDAAAADFAAKAAIRKAAAKTAREHRVKYREIGAALKVSTNRAYTLVNEDAEDAA